MITDDAPARKVPSVPALTHGIRILKHLAANPPQGVTAISRAVGVSPSSCFNILRTLVGEDFAEFDPDSKRYSLGGGAAALARWALDPDRSLEVARSVLVQLAADLGATCALWRVQPDNKLLLVRHEAGAENTRIDMAIGQRLPLASGSAGRSVLAVADLPAREIQAHFREVRWASPLSFETYLAELQATRLRGWALDEGALIKGITSIAATVGEDGGLPRFCISTSVFDVSHSKEFLDRIGQATLKASHVLARRMYGLGAPPAGAEAPGRDI